MNNINKVKLNGEIVKIPQGWEGSVLSDAQFPKHIWVTKEKDKDKGLVHMIYTYKNPQFDEPNSKYADYWMEYEGVFDTPQGLLHQLRHMNAKNWFTNKMTVELMDAVNEIHFNLTGKQHWSWSYRKSNINY